MVKRLPGLETTARSEKIDGCMNDDLNEDGIHNAVLRVQLKEKKERSRTLEYRERALQRRLDGLLLMDAPPGKLSYAPDERVERDSRTPRAKKKSDDKQRGNAKMLALQQEGIKKADVKLTTQEQACAIIESKIAIAKKSIKKYLKSVA
jgi:hypothetical protein